jgi:hypothetical protein
MMVHHNSGIDFAVPVSGAAHSWDGQADIGTEDMPSPPQEQFELHHR